MTGIGRMTDDDDVVGDGFELCGGVKAGAVFTTYFSSN